MTTTGQIRINEQTSRLALIPITIWNAVMPVARLPPEILAYTFVYCAQRYYDENLDGHTGVPKWVNVSHVCSHWRHVALNCPTLWSYMFVASPRWTDASLIRSKEVPLRIRIDFSLHRETALEFMEQVAPHAERFRECFLGLQILDTKIVFPMLSERSAPLLHTLAITFSHILNQRNEVNVDVEVEYDVFDTTHAVGSHTLFNGDTPALRELHLSDYVTSWCSPTLSGLTVLRLRDLHYSVRPTIAELSAILNRMPGLEQLYLENAIRGGLYDPAALDGEKVHLPRLAHFLITAPFSRLVWFLSSIDIPATAQVRLGCRLETNLNADNFAPFYTFLSRRFGNSENKATRTRSMLATSSAQRRMVIAFSASKRTCGLPRCNTLLHKDCDCNTPLKVEIDWRSQPEHWERLTVGICRSVPLAYLTNLIVNRCRLPSALWSDVLWHLPRLLYIELVGGDFMDILTALLLSFPPLPENADRPTDQPTNKLFAPSLKALYLNGVQVPRNIRCGGSPNMHGRHATLFLAALARRKAAGHGLLHLIINGNFSFGQRELARLEQVVNQVVLQRFARFLPDDKTCEDCKDSEAFEG
ncbi:hypothetical protein HD554DRAFT_1441745 [Boletus coccyginus]|nr:hypothetical protein HD554DRAFT_1441745 [Boletus coccyginus]